MLEETYSYLTAFSNKWKNILLPQIQLMLMNHEPVDVTAAFENSNCNLIKQKLKAGFRVYAITFKNCKGLVEKWMINDDGERVRDESGFPLITKNYSTVSMCVTDTISEFINSDEILSIKTNRERAYNLKREDVIKAIHLCGADPETDSTFFFIRSPDEVKAATTLFLDTLRYILEEAVESPKRNVVEVGEVVSINYPHETLTTISNNFIHDNIVHTVSKRSSKKRLNF